jgi:beta-glucosidase
MHSSVVIRRVCAALFVLACPASLFSQPVQPRLIARSAPILQQDGLRFKDSNRNGVLDPYEDWRLSPQVRAQDLVSRLTLEEKAGAMTHGTARSLGRMSGAGIGERYDTAANRALIGGAQVNSMITRLGGPPATLAAEQNTLQAIAEGTRLGVPLTISTDPRHHFQYVIGASVAEGQFSQWPETLGLAALGDTALVRRFADIARQEYRAAGIHMALSPQADLATEPRWSRISGTFGEDADLAGRMVRAYVEGFQHGANGVDSVGVATVVKHWVGYGAQKDGLDSHSFYGRFASFKGSTLEYHVRPFLGAFALNVAGVMPTYSILEGATWENRPLEAVGAAFNKQLLTDALRRRYGFRGLVLTDWAVTEDCGARCRTGAPAGERPTFADVAMPWGVEDLTMRARFVKAIQAGVDQFGGTERAEMIVQAVRGGELSEARVDSSVLRVMQVKFALGLFENPYVDAAPTVTTDAFREAGLDAQRRALVLLENKKKLLPIHANAGKPALRVYLYGVSPAAATREGWSVVNEPKDADVAIMRLGTPFETPHPGYIFGSMMHEGSLEFRDGNKDYEAFKRASAAVPTIVTVYLDRPAILTPIKEHAASLIGNFGVSDAALLDVLTGRAQPEGRLPFALPASMSDVMSQHPAAAHDIARPLYAFGYGLRY